MKKHELNCDSEKDESSNDTVTDSAHILLRRVFRILRGCGLSLSHLQSVSETALSEVQGIPRPDVLRCCLEVEARLHLLGSSRIARSTLN